LQTATTIDFDPDTLNLESKGKWVTVNIELPEGYNVGDIDVSTIELFESDTSIPAELHPTEIGDYDDDGIPDLMVKFDRSSVKDLFLEKTVLGNYIMEVTGTVSNIRFTGSDILWVVSPPRLK